MRIIFMDKDKSLCWEVEKLFKRHGNKFGGKELVVDYGDIRCKDEGVFVTASNPDFNPGGGLDLLLHNKFPEEWVNLKEGVRTDHLFPVISVWKNLKSHGLLIRRALALVLAQDPDIKEDFYLTGIGTDIGGFPKEAFIKIFEGLLDGYWKYVNLVGVHIDKAFLPYLYLRNCFFEKAQLEGACLADSVMYSCDFAGTNLKGANLGSSNILECGMRRTILKDASLRYANFNRTGLTDSDLRGADLNGALIRQADLVGAKVSRTTNLQETSFDAMTVREFLDRYKLKRNGDKIILYKGVTSEYLSPFVGKKKYAIGKILTEKYCNFNGGEICASGLHVSPTIGTALRYGENVMEVEVDIKDIVAIPSDGSKIRVKRLKVLEEVNLDSIRK